MLGQIREIIVLIFFVKEEQFSKLFGHIFSDSPQKISTFSRKETSSQTLWMH